MPNIKSAKKRVKVNAKKAAANKAANSALKTAIKKANVAIETNAADKDALVKDAVKKIITRIEGYANAGLEHLQTLYNTKKEMFRDPFVFVNILRDIK